MKFSQIVRNALYVFTVLIVFSCGTDAEDEAAELFNVPSTTELKLAAQVDNTEDQSFSIAETAYIEGVEDSRNVNESLFPSCTTITINPNGDGSGSIVVAFEDGCVLNNGAVVSGNINIDYGAIVNASRTITYAYDNFTHNGNDVSGGGTIVRMLENGNGNPQGDLTGSIEVYFPTQDVTATRTVNRTREWIEGVGSGTWTDNVVLVTGNWNTSFSSGFTRSGVVTEALRREATCANFVSGVLEITQNSIDGTLDYGNGNCDNVAVITIAGQDYTIQL